MKKHFWVIFAVLSVLFLVACNDSGNDNSSSNGNDGGNSDGKQVSTEPIKVGVLAS